ncbi:hypothetical protein Lal_00040024 [Lupinus albus]|nr:hypothetical protein Lal_00040024 [Lupinus albus]
MAKENANFIVTDDLPNPVAARDMSIVGRLWAKEEEVEESFEEEPFVEVQSKAQQKKMKKKMQGFGNAKTRLVLKNYCLENKPYMVIGNSNQKIISAFEVENKQFHKVWLSNVDCQRVVADVWRVEVVGCPMFVLSQKLKLLKKELKTWNSLVFGNIHERVKIALASVDSIQGVINILGHDEELLLQESLAQSELLQALEVGENFWKEKARMNWQVDEDRNTSFFHKVTKIRQAYKALSTIRDGDNILTSQAEIAQHTLAYFTQLYASHNNGSLSFLIQEVILALVSEEDNCMLSKLPYVEEIKIVVFDMSGDGAPELDGFGEKRKKRAFQEERVLGLILELEKRGVATSARVYVATLRLDFMRRVLLVNRRMKYARSGALGALDFGFTIYPLCTLLWWPESLTLFGTPPGPFLKSFPHVVEDMVQVNICMKHDKLNWQGTIDGTLSLKAAFIYLRPAIEE